MVAVRNVVIVSIVQDVITVTTVNTALTATGAGLVSIAGTARDVQAVQTVRTASIALAALALSAKLVGLIIKPRSNKMYNMTPSGLQALVTASRQAVNGDGPFATEWKDKPHRLVYDLCLAVEYMLDEYHDLDCRYSRDCY